VPFRDAKPHLAELARDYFAHMTPFGHLSLEDRQALADWLLARR
jgi:hypothetical protein